MGMLFPENRPMVCMSTCHVCAGLLSIEVELEREWSLRFSDRLVANGDRFQQSPVVTCPHCNAVVWWREGTLAPEGERKAPNATNATNATNASWTFEHVTAYQEEFLRLDKQVRASEGLDLTDIARFQAIRRRADLALPLLWSDNDGKRADQGHISGNRFNPHVFDAPIRDKSWRESLLASLVQHAREEPMKTQEMRLALAEWYRELGRWAEALAVLDASFEGSHYADQARILRDLAEKANPEVVLLLPTRILGEELKRQRVAARQAERDEQQRKKSVDLDAKGGRVLLKVVQQDGGRVSFKQLVEHLLPKPFSSIVNTVTRTYGWPQEEMAVLLLLSVARHRGWPYDAPPALIGQLRAREEDAEILSYLVDALHGSTWDRWDYDVPTSPPPRAGNGTIN